jgi:hypothetical protein
MSLSRGIRDSLSGIRRTVIILLACGVLTGFVVVHPAPSALRVPGAPAAQGTQPAAQALPSRISDADFWSLVTDLSEPDGSFPFDNLVSNETTFQSVLPRLQAKVQPGGAYLGVGPEQNFTYIAALQPKIAFIIDIRRQNLVEHLMYKALFELSADRAEFVSRLFSRTRPSGLGADSTATQLFRAFEAAPADAQLFDSNLREIADNLTSRHHMLLSARDLTSLRYVYTRFFREGPRLNYSEPGSADASMPTYTDLMTQTDANGEHQSYLASEERYGIVKRLEGDNLVIPVVGDFGGPTAIREVGRYLSSHGATVTAFYLSNVERYLFDRRRSWRRFYDNVAVLPYDDRSLFIRAILNRPASTLVTLLSPITDLMKAVDEGRIHEYQDVFSIANY